MLSGSHTRAGAAAVAAVAAAVAVAAVAAVAAGRGLARVGRASHCSGVHWSAGTSRSNAAASPCAQAIAQSTAECFRERLDVPCSGSVSTTKAGARGKSSPSCSWWWSPKNRTTGFRGCSGGSAALQGVGGLSGSSKRCSTRRMAGFLAAMAAGPSALWCSRRPGESWCLAKSLARPRQHLPPDSMGSGAWGVGAGVPTGS